MLGIRRSTAFAHSGAAGGFVMTLPSIVNEMVLLDQGGHS